MKRVPIFLLCILLILSLAGCSEPPTKEEKATVIKELSSNIELDELQTLYLSIDRYMSIDDIKSMVEETGLVVDSGSFSLECGYDPEVIGAWFGTDGDFIKIKYSDSTIDSISYYNHPKNITLEEKHSFTARSVNFKEKEFESKKEQIQFLNSYEYTKDDFEERKSLSVTARERWRNPELAEKEKMEKEKEVLELAKSTALVLDKQIFDIVVNSEKTTQILKDGVALVTQGKGDLLELYDLAKTAKENQLTFFTNLSKLQDENNKDYINACQIYVSNSRSIADNLIKYLDKQELKYMSEVSECIEYESNYSSSIIIERTKYLSSQGLSDEEISETLSLEGETE